jgi:hypothetical protein
MKVQPWMLGVGVLGVAGAGVLVYEAFNNKPAAAAPPKPAVTPVPTPAAIPTIAVTRPPATPITTPTNVFSTTPVLQFGIYPTGPVLNFANGDTSLSASPTTGQNLTLVLPAGATWAGLAALNSSNTSVVLGQVLLGGDTVSPISIPVANLPKGTNELWAVWVDTTGAETYTMVSVPLVQQIVQLKLKA